MSQNNDAVVGDPSGGVPGDGNGVVPVNSPFPALPGVIPPDDKKKKTEVKGDDEGENECNGDPEQEGKDKEVPVSPFHIADEIERVSTGPSRVIASEIKLLVDVNECAEILSLLTLHFRYLNKEICACGVRLTKKYKELGACSNCSSVKNPVNKILCMNCKVITLKGKWIEEGYCSSCLSGMKKRDKEMEDAKMGAKCGKKKK